MKAFNQSALNVAQIEGVVVIDAEPAVPKELGYFRDDVHYTKQGASLLAETAADKIVQEKIIEQLSP